jgi:Zn-dependent M16 (insulinase) family peptidase
VAYNGRFEVVKKLLSRDYLWNKVRVQGNAYGCFASHDLISGQFACVSYRDPNLRDTLATYDAFADYLADLRLPQEEFDKLLIGTLGGLDAPRPPDQQGAVAYSRYRAGITQAMIQQWRDELLASQPADLPQYAELFRRFARDGQVCVLGGDDPLRAAADCFRSLTTVFAQAPATNGEDAGPADEDEDAVDAEDDDDDQD